MALGALPLTAVAQFGGRGTPPPPPKSNFGGVQIGVITYSFRQGIKAEDLIPTINKLGINAVELMSNHAEALAGAPATPNFFGGARGPGRGPGGPGRGRPQLTPEQQAAMQAAREELNKWRASVPMDAFKAVRKKFDDANIDLKILCYNLAASATDEEIDYSFRMAQALGVNAISSSSTVSVAKRVAPIAEKYKLLWGGHGHDAIDDPEQFATLESYAKIMSFGKYIGVNLDIGHFTAAGYDAVSYIKEHHDRITNLHLKDRKKGRGPNTRWGEGDTPIKDVLLLLKKEKYPFPADIEYEYFGTDPVIEVAKCLEYCRDILIA
ncbi:MAG TPA: sugar phosphate isomerase/epimerase [Bryobacteraceae bacterium]|nr:sugar phosphate isomerase/epimerase [Bryobacteraceae bacterium]